MPKRASYDILIDGETIEVLLAMWLARLIKMDGWGSRKYCPVRSYDDLRTVYHAASQAHTDLTGLHIYQARNAATSAKVQRQLQIAIDSHRKAEALYRQLLNDMAG